MRLFSFLAIVFGVLSSASMTAHQFLVIAGFESGWPPEKVVCAVWLIGVHSIICLLACIASAWISCWPHRNK